MSNSTLPWIGFNLFLLVMLALDLGVFHKKAKEVKVKEALIWSAVWIGLALLFNAVLYFYKGEEAALQFLTGYLIEKSLSIDNIFVFILIFSFFQVPAAYQHRVLFWGILGALIMRAIFIATGISLLEQFHWIIYVFGAFLLITGIKIAVNKGTSINPENNFVVKIFRKFFRVTNEYHGSKFWIKENGVRTATPLFLSLLLIEFTDLIFAVDSIPAILAVTNDAFIIYSSNVFAILGLRSLYFALAGIVHRFKYLHWGLALVLIFVGAKMLVSDFYKFPALLSLCIIILILAGSIIFSLYNSEKKEP